MRLGDFHGYQTVIIENEHFQLECLASAGPRIVRLIPNWMGENIFAEAIDAVVRTALGRYRFYGGHRLWFAPKQVTQTYFPDNHGVTVKETKHGLDLVGSIEPDTHTRKTISLQMSPGGPFVMIKHKLENMGRHAIRLAPCAITMLRPKSVALLPQQHGTIDVDGFLPNRNFALWSYSHWSDPRLKLENDFIRIKSDATRKAFRFGYFNPHGWMGYVFEDALFVKRFGVRSDEAYPDHGCNAEVYSTDRVLELESLAPFVEIKPQEEVVHTETWEVYKTNDIPKDLLGEKTLDEILK